MKTKLTPTQQKIVDDLKSYPFAWVSSDGTVQCPGLVGIAGESLKTNVFRSLIQKQVLKYGRLSDSQIAEYNRRKEQYYCRPRTPTHGYILQEMKVNKQDCPDFSDHDFEKILEWGKVKVEYNDRFVGSDGEVTSHPELASWVMSWGHGVISFDSIDKDEEQLARKAAAMFVYLWCKGVDAMYADRCAKAYVKTWTVTKVQ